MKRTAVIFVALVFSLVCCAYADYAGTDSGTWPKSWPAELEPLRKQSSTFEGPVLPLLHYAIPFTKRDEFESAWPHLLKIKSKGAPIVLRRAPSFWLGDKATAGACVHTPPAGQDPIADGKDAKGNWEKTISIELIVDGAIIDLNRIPLPADTPIIDDRFPKTVPAKHSQKEVSAKLKIAIEKDSSIPDQGWQSLDARNQPIDHKKINGTTLTSAFISMRAPDEPDKPKSDELEVFKTSTVVRIIDEIERVKAPYTFIHADRITDLDFKIDNDTAQGTFSFLVTDLYKGKIGYRAKLTASGWRITEFLLPAHGIHLVRDGDTWTNISLQ